MNSKIVSSEMFKNHWNVLNVRSLKCSKIYFIMIGKIRWRWRKQVIDFETRKKNEWMITNLRTIISRVIQRCKGEVPSKTICILKGAYSSVGMKPQNLNPANKWSVKYFCAIFTKRWRFKSVLWWKISFWKKWKMWFFGLSRPLMGAGQNWGL